MSSPDPAAAAEQLSGLGIDLDEARRQIDLLLSPPEAPRLVRPCVLGDGIRRISDSERPELERAWQESATAGRFTKFVPASGAATRMFAAASRALEGEALSRHELVARGKRGDGAAAELVELLDRVAELPFFAQLRRVLDGSPAEVVQLARSDGYPRVLEAMLSPQGLGYRDRAKALIPFHRYPDGSRTAFEEHLVEGASYLRDAEGVCRFHFTVPSEQRTLFDSRAERRRHGAWTPSITFSEQHSRTDTLALEMDGTLARRADGRIVLRPGGHGALIDNLDALGADLVYLKNIDNVLPEPRQTVVTEWQRLLGGLVTVLENRVHRTLAVLRTSPTPSDCEAAERLCSDELGRAPERPRAEGRPDSLIRRLDRPLRVCGVVPHRGEPGGGPFWVRGRDGRPTRQIVEGAQVDLEDADQAEIWRSSTHFNPVMLVGALGRGDGKPYRLAEFVDSRAVLIAEKPHRGRRLRVLERPGLWNGAMAGWNSVFVEVPLQTFAPVKSVVDLLRPEHQL